MEREELYKAFYWQMTLSMRGFRDDPNCEEDKRYQRLRSIRRSLYEEMIELGYEIPGPPHVVLGSESMAEDKEVKKRRALLCNKCETELTDGEGCWNWSIVECKTCDFAVLRTWVDDE